ncbi:hypothetical protein ACWD3I_13045 [Streptomyces sp. NPDC002817]|uniref:hypothetical protein n=1 Tax=Streptomyces sp. NPDC088357 TaxID=3154655 RepID=UPI00343E09E3
MSDTVLSVIPTDPHRQPWRPAADRATALVTALTGGLAVDTDVEVDVDRYAAPAVVDSGQNLTRIGCPHCRGSIDLDWWAELVADHQDGFASPSADVPCCDATTSLDTLDFDWPCGFARFEIAAWNPELSRLTDEQPAAVAKALGHPVRQIRAHI